MSIDAQIYQWIGRLRGTSTVLDNFMLLFEMNTLKYLVIGLLACLLLSKNARLQRRVFVAMLAIAASIFLRPLYKNILYRDRPWVEFGCPGLAECYPDSAFPSGHAFLIFAVTGALWRSSRKAGVVMLVVAFWMCVSRIYLGEHWPSDLIAGALLGGAVGYGLSLMADFSPLSGLLDRAVQATRRVRSLGARQSATDTQPAPEATKVAGASPAPPG